MTLAGTASSSAEHDEAVDAAWSAPGVTEVDDQTGGLMVPGHPRVLLKMLTRRRHRHPGYTAQIAEGCTAAARAGTRR